MRRLHCRIPSMARNPTADYRPGDSPADARLITFSVMAALVGVISAFVALALVRLIGLFTNVAYFHRLATSLVSPAASEPGLWSLPIPVVGGLIVGRLARYGSEKIRGHGIPEAMEAILIGRSRIEARVAVLKPLSSAIAIGTGGPFGAEGPIIATGGAFGSVFAQAFHLSPVERKTLLVAGAAAGMAAIFASPVAAVLLAVELLLFEWKPRSFIPVACAAAVAAALRVPLLGAGPDFAIPPHHLLAATTLAECLGGGLVAPRPLGVGYAVIHDLVAGRLVGTFLLVLLVVKALIWAIGLGSGTSGGVLAPLLVMGGTMGALGASALHRPDPGLWAIVGMAALVGGTMQVPLTAVIFVLELTGDFAALPGLLIGSIAAAGVTVLLMRRSILTEKLARRGRHVTREYGVNPLHVLRVEDVMEPPVAPRTAAVAPVVVYPDELLETAMRKLLEHELEVLPVASPDDPGRVVGYVERSAILGAWVQHTRDEHTREEGWLGRLRRASR